jgi:hypothetical protein
MPAALAFSAINLPTANAFSLPVSFLPDLSSGERLDAATSVHQIEWLWVKGHAGHIENERADELANRGVEEMQGQL